MDEMTLPTTLGAESERARVRMSDRTRLALAALGAALLLGILGDGLLRATPWGINAVLWLMLLLGTLLALMRWQFPAARGGGRWMIVPALLFAAAIAWRGSGVLVGLSVLAVLVSLALLAARAREGQWQRAGLGEYVLALPLAGVNAALGAFALLTDVEWQSIPRGGWSGQAIAIVRGTLIAAPLLLLFGGLFMAADADFEALVLDLLDWEWEEIASHLFWAAVWAWLVAGFFRQSLLERTPPSLRVPQPRFLGLGIVESTIVLGTMNLLFLAFVLVQFPYLFGGSASVDPASGLSYSAYARRGFFELVTVATLLLPLLLLLHWLLRDSRPWETWLFRGLAGTLVLLMYVVMLSALQRMWLYTAEFGLTELRFYTTAFMGWLAVVFLLFLLTVLRGQRERLAFGALLAAFATLLLLLAINPDALIVRTNVGRVEQAAQPFDREYVVSLSADAVPPLVALIDQMPAEDRCRVADRLLLQWSPSEQMDWRTWNWARWQARRTVSANQERLEGMSCTE